MNKKTILALKGAIDKWQKIVDFLEPRKRWTDNISTILSELERGDDNCPLCQLYTETGCGECPISIATEEAQCEGTSYHRFVNAVAYRELKVAKSTAKKMLTLLESLRED